MLDITSIREDFPILGKEYKGRRIIYLDSAATSQKPRQVIEAVSEYYSERNCNVARGLYKLAEEATLEYEGIRKKAAAFINAEVPEEVIFLRNTTEASNVIMRGWGEKFLSKGDKVVTTIMEHHSNFVPWQQAAKMTGASFEVVDITDEGLIDISDFEKKIKDAKLFAISAASNVIGTMPDVKKLCAEAKDEGAVCVVDGAQSVPSNRTDVRDIGCDFLTFSGHKMCAPFASGVLYGRRELLERMDPLLYGSEMIRSVTVEASEWNGLPQKFEAGTPSADAVTGLGAAMDYLSGIGLDDIRAHEEELIRHMLKRLPEVEGLEVLGPRDEKKRTSLVAFTLENVHPHDVAAMLDEDNICLRSGHHCAMPLHDRLGIPASTRASVYLYSTKDEIDALVESLKNVKKIFG